MIASAQFHYPQPEKGTTVDDYFGTKVRIIPVDGGCRCSETKEWVEQENKLTFDYLEKIRFRNKIKRMEELWNYPIYSPQKKIVITISLQERRPAAAKRSLHQDGEHGSPRVLIDPIH